MVLLDECSRRVAGTIFIAVHSDIDERRVFLVWLSWWLIALSVPVEDVSEKVEFFFLGHGNVAALVHVEMKTGKLAGQTEGLKWDESSGCLKAFTARPWLHHLFIPPIQLFLLHTLPF